MLVYMHAICRIIELFEFGFNGFVLLDTGGGFVPVTPRGGGGFRSEIGRYTHFLTIECNSGH